jgi:excinuclease UvrABC helicase subunit UvrB
LASTSSAKASASRSLPRAILHANKMTDPMQRAIDETDTRREKQVF